MKVAIAQISTDPGHIDKNVEKMKAYIDEAEGNADIVVFPELAIPGYIPLDLIFDDQFVSDNIKALDEIKQYTEGREILVVVGFIRMDGRYTRPDGLSERYNTLAAINDGHIIYLRDKALLPSYDIFYEKRYFSTSREDDMSFAEEPPVLKFKGKKIGFLICEDLWDENYDFHPIENFEHHRKYSGGIDFIITINASPFIVNKKDQRLAILERAAKIVNRPIIYVNRVGAIDGYDGEIVFDGSSSVVDGRGNLVLELPSFKECLMNYDEEEHTKPIEMDEPIEIEQMHDALVEGIREYVRRSGFFQKTLIGLSGGIDSAVVAALAVEALGSDNVVGVTMPSKYSADNIKGTAYQLAENLGIKIHEIPIKDPVANVIERIQEDFDEGKVLQLSDLTQQNIQARMRGNYLMALSNEFGYLLLTTGNKTEMALGYCTLYGDMSGGLAVISDVNKMDVYAIARFINEKHKREMVPVETIELPPTAELTSGQTDEESLGAPYKVLAPLVDDIVEEGKSFAELANLYGPELVVKIYKMVHRAEYKRRQAPPGIKVTGKAFGIGRRIPMMHGFTG